MSLPVRRRRPGEPRKRRRKPRYSNEPPDTRGFTESFDILYSRTARVYDLAVKAVPVWRRWLRHALPHLQGPRILEVSFGTGWLLTRYAGQFDAYGLDLNARMVAIAHRNLVRAGVAAGLVRGDVGALLFRDDSFDTVVITMAFSGYPDGARALREVRRVLRPCGRLVVIDMAYPRDGNRLGAALVGLWRWSGDVIRDMPAMLTRFGLDVADEEIGGWGSVHLYVAHTA